MRTHRGEATLLVTRGSIVQRRAQSGFHRRLCFARSAERHVGWGIEVAGAVADPTDLRKGRRGARSKLLEQRASSRPDSRPNASERLIIDAQVRSSGSFL